MERNKILWVFTIINTTIIFLFIAWTIASFFLPLPEEELRNWVMEENQKTKDWVSSEIQKQYDWGNKYWR